jgi:hypothetical protein
MAEIYCVYEAIYDHDGYTHFSHIGTYTDYNKCIKDTIKMEKSLILPQVTELGPCHDSMDNREDAYIYEGLRTDCYKMCPEKYTCSYHGGFVIEKAQLNMITKTPQ